MNNAVADQKWIDFFNAIERGEIAKVKMLFEANRSLFLNSAYPHYSGLVWIPLTSSSSSLSSSLSWSSFIWFHFISFIHSFICDMMMMITIKWGRGGRRTRSWSWLWRWWLRWWRWSELFNNLMMVMIMSIHLNYMMIMMMMSSCASNDINDDNDHNM